MIKKMAASKGRLVCAIVFITIFSLLFIWGAVWLFPRMFPQAPVIFLLLLGPSVLLILQLIFALNRDFCSVWIDLEQRRIGRKGLLWGYFKEISFDEIVEVVSVMARGGSVLLVAERCGKGAARRSGRYIAMSDTPANRIFLRRAWGGAPCSMTIWEWLRYRKTLGL